MGGRVKRRKQDKYQAPSSAESMFFCKKLHGQNRSTCGDTLREIHFEPGFDVVNPMILGILALYHSHVSFETGVVQACVAPNEP